MGRQKEELARLEDLYAHAQGIAAQAGAIRECEHHPGIFITCEDTDAEEEAYAIAIKEMKNEEPSFKSEELIDAIKSAINDAGEECGYCAKLERE